MGLFNLFSKKQEPQYEIPAKLEALINMVLKKGEVSEKDLAVLRAEAQKHDISEGELDLILESRLPKKIEWIDSQIVENIISSNIYSKEDNIEKIFQKYSSLSECGEKNLSANDRNKLCRAQITFIDAIVVPEDKEAMLDLITRAIPYSKHSMSVDAVVAGVKSFFKNFNSELGISDGANQNDEKVQQNQYRKSLAEAWDRKIERLIQTAKKTFGKEKRFMDELDLLEEQFNNVRCGGHSSCD